MNERYGVLTEAFNVNKQAQIICNFDGSDCILNGTANRQFSQFNITSLQDLFLDLPLLNKPLDGIFNTLKGEQYFLSISVLEMHQQCIITVTEQNEWQRFSHFNLMLHDMFIELASITEQDDLFKQVVQISKQKLELDRICILLIDEKTDQMQGTFGISAKGELDDLRNLRKPMFDCPWVKTALDKKYFVDVKYDFDLYEGENIVGKGWNCMAVFWDGDLPLGWVACDNLLSHQPLPDWKKEIIGELARMVGHMLVRLRQQKNLRQINNHLGNLVTEKTQTLQTTIDNLQNAQQELIEAEKLASLGALVAGVSHEINTPIGISLTAASFQQEISHNLYQDIENNKLSKSKLQAYLSDSIESSDITVRALRRASDLVQSFKQLGVNQVNDVKQEFVIDELINSVTTSFSHKTHKKGIKIISQVRSNISILSHPGQYIQILSNLINNSLLHGFPEEEYANNHQAQIHIQVVEYKNIIKLIYKDNGIGIAQEHFKDVFEPFYTTKRNKGGTGLGLSIVYNLVKQLGGKIEIQANAENGVCFTLRMPKQVSVKQPKEAIADC